LRLDQNANFSGRAFGKTNTGINERAFNLIDGTILAVIGGFRVLDSLDGGYSNMRPLGE
jgi:hypothetical protein